MKEKENGKIPSLLLGNHLIRVPVKAFDIRISMGRKMKEP